MMLSETQQRIFEDFHRAVDKEGTLDAKTTQLIRLAVTMALGCYPCMERNIAAARENGISDREIGAAQLIAMTVAAGMVKARVRDVMETRL